MKILKNLKASFLLLCLFVLISCTDNDINPMVYDLGFYVYEDTGKGISSFVSLDVAEYKYKATPCFASDEGIIGKTDDFISARTVSSFYSGNENDDDWEKAADKVLYLGKFAQGLWNIEVRGYGESGACIYGGEIVMYVNDNSALQEETVREIEKNGLFGEELDFKNNIVLKKRVSGTGRIKLQVEFIDVSEDKEDEKVLLTFTDFNNAYGYCFSANDFLFDYPNEGSLFLEKELNLVSGDYKVEIALYCENICVSSAISQAVVIDDTQTVIDGSVKTGLWQKLYLDLLQPSVGESAVSFSVSGAEDVVKVTDNEIFLSNDDVKNQVSFICDIENDSGYFKTDDLSYLWFVDGVIVDNGSNTLQMPHTEMNRDYRVTCVITDTKNDFTIYKEYIVKYVAVIFNGKYDIGGSSYDESVNRNFILYTNSRPSVERDGVFCRNEELEKLKIKLDSKYGIVYLYELKNAYTLDRRGDKMKYEGVYLDMMNDTEKPFFALHSVSAYSGYKKLCVSGSGHGSVKVGVASALAENAEFLVSVELGENSIELDISMIFIPIYVRLEVLGEGENGEIGIEARKEERADWQIYESVGFESGFEIKKIWLER